MRERERERFRFRFRTTVNSFLRSHSLFSEFFRGKFLRQQPVLLVPPPLQVLHQPLQLPGAGHGVLPDLGPPEGGHVRARPHALPQVVHQGPHVSPLAAPDVKVDRLRVPTLLPPDPELVHPDGPRLPLHRDALPRELVQLLALPLDGGEHGGKLHDLPHEAGRRLGDVPVAQVHPLRRPLHRGAVVVRARGLAQPQGPLIRLAQPLVVVHRLGRPAHAHDQQAGRLGVQRAGVAHLLGPHQAPELAAHVEGGPVQGLVDEKDLVVPVLRQGPAGGGAHDLHARQNLRPPPRGLGAGGGRRRRRRRRRG
mmetsp:Transcript_235/g.545  ORF Transcript_235/g.545 Transcript_235/m.545 type:complete len:309 (-) Transcript_235:798-1724(-)